MTDRGDVTAIVLAGGRASRFGGPKLQADLDGLTVLERTIRAVGTVAGTVIVAGPPPTSSEPDPEAEPRDVGATVRQVADEEPFGGPLAALAGALGATTSPFALVVGGDMPALVPAVLERMLATLASNPASAAVTLEDTDDPARRQVLPLAVRTTPALEVAVKRRRAGDRALAALLDHLAWVAVLAADWRALDPAGHSLLDVDVPADLDVLRAGPAQRAPSSEPPRPLRSRPARAAQAPSASARRDVMPMVQEFWNKLNGNEKLVMYGAVAIVVAFLLGTVGGGYGTASTSLVAAIAVAVVYWLKYSPNKISWPVPIQTIVLAIAGISAIFALLGLLSWFGFLGFGLFGIAILINAVGAGLMAYGAWKEYQAMPKATPPAPPAPPAA